MNNKIRSGFTLLEISIVLVIIALLIGGIIFARSLLVTSRLQAIITDYDAFTSATNNFKQQYQSLPGDFVNATSIWGTDSNGCPTGGGTTGTCNGNGDGMINNNNAASQANESFLFWQHLYLAGMFTQSLLNTAGSGNASEAVPGKNVPFSGVEGGAFAIMWSGKIPAGDANYFPAFYGNAFSYGKFAAGGRPKNAALTPDQAAGIDSKIDDGIPNTGIVIATIPSAPATPNCTTGTGPYSYNVSYKSIACPLFFINGN